MWKNTTLFYETCVPRDGDDEEESPIQGRTKLCVPRDGDDEQESPSPVEKGERARLRVGGSHGSLPFKDGVTSMIDIRTHHQNGSKESYGRCTNLSTIALTRNGLPSLSGKDKALCPPARGKGPALAGRGFARLSAL